MSGLTGEVHASLGGLAVSDTRSIREAMSERGRSQGGAATYAGNGVSVWGSGVYGDGRGSAHDGIAGFRSEGSGYLVGAEKALADDMHIGVALGEDALGTAVVAPALDRPGQQRTDRRLWRRRRGRLPDPRRRVVGERRRPHRSHGPAEPVHQRPGRQL